MTNFIPFIYNGYYNYPSIHDQDKDIKVWLVEDSEFHQLPDNTGIKGSFVDQEGKQQFYMLTEKGMLRSIPTSTYLQLHEHCVRISHDDGSSRLHIDPDYLISLYDQKFLGFSVNEYDKRIIQWQTKEELRIRQEKLDQEKAARAAYNKGKNEALEPFITRAKAGADKLTEEQDLLVQRILGFDFSYEYSDDVKVYRHWAAVEKEIIQDSIRLGFGEGALKAVSVFIFNFKWGK